jgi:hypothetical protein
MNDSSPSDRPDEVTFDAAPRPRSRWLRSRWRRWAAVALVAGVFLGGAGAAIAATDTPSPEPSSPADSPGAQAPSLKRQGGVLGLGRAGRHLPGLFGALHGEFVVPKADGGYQTLAMQRGEVVSVSTSEIKVKSADGFEKAYTVTGDTAVNGGRDGIDSVRGGEQVYVVATVADRSYTALQVVDVNDVRRPFERFGPRRFGPDGSPTAPATPS